MLLQYTKITKTGDRVFGKYPLKIYEYSSEGPLKIFLKTTDVPIKYIYFLKKYWVVLKENVL